MLWPGTVRTWRGFRKKDPQAYELYSQAVQELQSLESQERTGFWRREGAPVRDLMMQARPGWTGSGPNPPHPWLRKFP